MQFGTNFWIFAWDFGRDLKLSVWVWLELPLQKLRATEPNQIFEVSSPYRTGCYVSRIAIGWNVALLNG